VKRRASGVLLHLTCLPSGLGIGDLGPAAHSFVDLLAEAGQSYWQILPLNPTSPDRGNSPYESPSAFAGNPLLISPELLIRDGLLTPADLESRPEQPSGRVDYVGLAASRDRLLERAYQRFKAGPDRAGFEEFCATQAGWLDDFALFSALKPALAGLNWADWPVDLRDRDEKSLARAGLEHGEAVESHKFRQYLFFRQWRALKAYANQKGVELIGDLPIYVTHDSVDVWANPSLFKLDRDKRPRVVAGVPPDYFSRTGQLWGNPVYDWAALKIRGFDWWLERLARNLDRVDWLRLDHFRGLVAYWEVPAGRETAVEGQWVQAPGRELLETVVARHPQRPFIAEDLGIITADVDEVRRQFDLPGMRVLLFAFGPDSAAGLHAPPNLIPDCVVYTGTHDNNTVRGWFEDEAGPAEKERLFNYLGRQVASDEVAWEMVRLALTSTADTAILPVQDILGLDGRARLNRPATKRGNWSWRLKPEELAAFPVSKLRELTGLSGRARPGE